VTSKVIPGGDGGIGGGGEAGGGAAGGAFGAGGSGEGDSGEGGGEGDACSRPKWALTFFWLPTSTVTVMIHGTVSIKSELAALVAGMCASSTVSVEKWSHDGGTSSEQRPLAVPVSTHAHACSLTSLGMRGLESSKPGEMSTDRTCAPSNLISLHAEVRPPRMVSWPVTTLLSEPRMENSPGHMTWPSTVGQPPPLGHVMPAATGSPGGHASSPGDVVAGRTVWHLSTGGFHSSVQVPISLPVPEVPSSYVGLHEPVKVHCVALGDSGAGDGGGFGEGGAGGGAGGLGGGAIWGIQQKTRTTPLPSPESQSNFFLSWLRALRGSLPASLRPLRRSSAKRLATPLLPLALFLEDTCLLFLPRTGSPSSDSVPSVVSGVSPV